jgi:hypothetical protein
MIAATEFVQTKEPVRGLGWFLYTFCTIVLLANLLLLLAAYRDSGWGALWLAVVGAPMMNGVAAVMGVITSLLIRRRLGAYFPLALGASLSVPVAAGVFDFLCILSMDHLHGC